MTRRVSETTACCLAIFLQRARWAGQALDWHSTEQYWAHLHLEHCFKEGCSFLHLEHTLTTIPCEGVAEEVEAMFDDVIQLAGISSNDCLHCSQNVSRPPDRMSEKEVTEKQSVD
jgi:hypothetical protein